MGICLIAAAFRGRCKSVGPRTPPRNGTDHGDACVYLVEFNRLCGVQAALREEGGVSAGDKESQPFGGRLIWEA